MPDTVFQDVLPGAPGYVSISSLRKPTPDRANLDRDLPSATWPSTTCVT